MTFLKTNLTIRDVEKKIQLEPGHPSIKLNARTIPYHLQNYYPTNSIYSVDLNDAENIYSIGEPELLAVVLGLENFGFYLYGKIVYLETDNQALEPLFKRNRAYWQNSARLPRSLVRLAHFDLPVKHTAGRKLEFTDL